MAQECALEGRLPKKGFRQGTSNACCAVSVWNMLHLHGRDPGLHWRQLYRETLRDHPAYRLTQGGGGTHLEGVADVFLRLHGAPGDRFRFSLEPSQELLDELVRDERPFCFHYRRHAYCAFDFRARGCVRATNSRSRCGFSRLRLSTILAAGSRFLWLQDDDGRPELRLPDTFATLPLVRERLCDQ